jgi:hypothetical protein
MERSEWSLHQKAAMVGVGMVLLLILLWFLFGQNQLTSEKDPVTTYAMVDTTLSNVPSSGSSSHSLWENPPSENGQLVRYLRLQRTVGTDFMSVSLLEAYQGTSSISYLFGLHGEQYCVIRVWICHRRLVAVDGIVTNQWMNDSWKNLNDENPITMAQTHAIPFSYMELDLGEGGKQVDRVRVLHTGGRLNNVTL